MSSVAQSFANIVSTNNGLFKSPAQASFLLSQCDGNEFVATGSVGRNSYALFYTCDQQGVIRIQKQTVANGLVLQWERRIEGAVSLQDAREIKRIKRLIKQTETSMESRSNAFASGQYPSEILYNETQARDKCSLEALHQMLSKLV